MDIVLPEELCHFLSTAIPDSRQLDIGFALFEFPRVEELIDFQLGYRWHGITRAQESAWDNNWLVLASSHGDPLIYHLKDGHILFARHGAGRWEPCLLFTDLAKMSRCFNEIAALITETDKALFDDNVNIQPTYVELIKAMIVNHVGLEQGNQIIEQLEIMAY
ncbi:MULTISPECIES: hypothetical protein [unclassified Shewanella]|uniref:hypothetical protein n=1 Tax=unclassified Shewanella TaxID=196818 RepID=UPI001C5B0D71|nr:MULTISPECIES: hypothetical protein [unclassified Shewanella]MBW3529625.1 hypothetical protein [Shewanella sp. NKUCC06_TVS]MCU8054900.1 hypothetical protein [Shewanella sp. SM35]MCU8063855.1 hypothetical protein [Shewanella sp. SM34]MCU8076413.1 hypothetical protein [Shewanella sp. SM29]